VADPIAAADTSRSRATVSIKLHDGRLVTKTIEDMLGTSRNPAPDAVYFDKFRSNVDGVISNAEAEELIERLMSLETASDVDGLLLPLRTHRARP
jgi:hypothetical protein